MKPQVKDIRPSPIAGTWYPGNPAKLRSSIEGYLAEAPVPEVPGEVVGLVVPHAGHVYSGPVAAYAFNAIKSRQFDTVVIVSPSHQYYREAILTSAHQSYGTPLGIIPIDKPLVDAISQNTSHTLGFGMEPIAYDEEHSLEIELPFLQVVLKQPFSLVPIMLRDQSPSTAHALADAIILNIKGKNVLLIASSDLSHFHSESQANRLDQAILDQVAAFNPDGLYLVHASGSGEACGLGPIATILWAARTLGADKVQVVNHNTSATITGDTHSVVGYGAAIITRPA